MQNAHQEMLKQQWYTRIFADGTVLMYKWAVLLITIIINLIMLLDWDVNVQKNTLQVSTWYTVLLYALGAVHLALSLSMATCTFIHYFNPTSVLTLLQPIFSISTGEASTAC